MDKDGKFFFYFSRILDGLLMFRVNVLKFWIQVLFW